MIPIAHAGRSHPRGPGGSMAGGRPGARPSRQRPTPTAGSPLPVTLGMDAGMGTLLTVTLGVDSGNGCSAAGHAWSGLRQRVLRCRRRSERSPARPGGRLRRLCGLRPVPGRGCVKARIGCRQSGAAEPRNVAEFRTIGNARAASNMADTESTNNACPTIMPRSALLASLA